VKLHGVGTKSKSIESYPWGKYPYPKFPGCLSQDPNIREFPVSESEEAARQAMTTEHRTATFRVDENQRFFAIQK